MHGMIGVASAQRNRKGRKRKQRINLAGGAVVSQAEPQVDYRALSAMQPHRRDLPDPLDERAGTVLGELLLLGKLGPHSYNRMSGKFQPSSEARKLYQAGVDFAGLVGAYHAVITTPRGTAGAGRGYDCKGDEFCDAVGSCECARRKRNYNDAYSALTHTTHDPLFGHKVLKVVSRTVVFDEPCGDELLPVLLMGLRTLSGHFESGRR